ncbi:hypothetical protein [Cohaesibacter sp. ES.047]|uniref:hypothetical protein n=1 Tax=Cohaesibacter sp. ES.047 TaxID=1798205 RepID=UPI0012FE0DE0|nr:hypothetical protein [Cohaesibacter sp. ES.047]
MNDRQKSVFLVACRCDADRVCGHLSGPQQVLGREQLAQTNFERKRFFLEKSVQKKEGQSLPFFSVTGACVRNVAGRRDTRYRINQD